MRAIVGTRVVLFGFDVPRERVRDLMGFALRRTDVVSGRSVELDNFLLFKANDTGDEADHSSFQNPFQEFVWGDYTLQPDRLYRYEVVAMYGKPRALERGASVPIEVRTESESAGVHGVFFNRGVAGSQAYSRRFTQPGQTKPPAPSDVGAKAFEWLSRGLVEALAGFIAQARGKRYGLRAAVYEFTCGAVLQEFAKAAASGADVQIVYDAVDNASSKQPIPYPRDANQAAIAKAKLHHCVPRTRTKIAHNKFVVLLRDGKPQAVWTGSTNITEGGLYGQWNAGHIVRDKAVAQRYLDFWSELVGDPAPAAARAWDGTATPVPSELPDVGVTSIFSPRRGLQALKWYARRMENANGSVFLTAAFGVNKELTAIFEQSKPYLRYLLLDKRNGKVRTIARNSGNRVVAGGYLGPRNSRFANWMEEALTDLNKHVQYVHTKFMLLDPLSDDPIVITGSANFSEASTTANDENMLVIRGDTRVADIYLGEFMRLFTHFRFRGKTRTPNHAPAPGPGNPAPTRDKLYLRETDAWARRFYVKDAPRTKERLLFRAAPRP